MRKHQESQVDRELINGKPHFGLWFWNYFKISGDGFVGNHDENPIMKMGINHLERWIHDRFSSHGEIRYKQVIIKPPLYSDPLNQWGTVGMKFVLWGRAFRVMSIIAKREPKWKKLRRGGKLKWVKLK